MWILIIHRGEETETVECENLDTACDIADDVSNDKVWCEIKGGRKGI